MKNELQISVPVLRMHSVILKKILSKGAQVLLCGHLMVGIMKARHIKIKAQTFAFCWKWGGGVNSLHHEGILCWEKLANANKTEQGKETNLLQKNAVSESEASRLCENLKEDKERKQNCITL